VFVQAGKTIVLSNLFYGLCAVSLCMETNYLLHLPLNYFVFYVLVAAVSAIYYTYIYLQVSASKLDDERLAWYRKHRKAIIIYFILLILSVIVAGIFYLFHFTVNHANWGLREWAGLLVFPLIALGYSNNPLHSKKLPYLRKMGFIKPFAIGFVWAGLVSYYPLIFFELKYATTLPVNNFTAANLFIQNFLFIAILCILFDVRDLPYDKQRGLQTFPVRLGNAATLQWVIVPLTILLLLLTVIHIEDHQLVWQLFNIRTIPVLLLLPVSYGATKSRSVWYYLVLIDGMMLLKALFGIAHILIFEQ
jgi:4-hydroxybenzoate polyprenyltransferase